MIGVLVIVALLVVAAAHYYLWRRLVRDTTRSRGARRLGTVVVVLLGLLLLATLIGSRVLPRGDERLVAWPGYIWLAALFYLLLILAVLEIPAALIRLGWRRSAVRSAAGHHPSPDAGPGPVPAAHSGPAPAPRAAADADPAADPRPAPDSGPVSDAGAAPAAGRLSDADRAGPGSSRRVFLARTVAVTAGVATAGLVAGGMRTALGPPGLKRIDIPLARLPRGADGLRIAVVSDIHLGPLRGYSHTRRIVDLINGVDADLVAIVGDLVDGTVADLGEAASPLRDLRSRQGSYFVTGNHEYFSGFQEWVDEVASFGVTPLRNARVELAGLDLAGVNDASGASAGDAPDYARAVAGRDPARPLVLLAHQPVQAHEAAAHGVDLQLSGHTHGGQLAPFNLVVRATGQPVVSGLGTVDGMPVYVTNGAGFWGPPVRVGAPPDITVVRLRSV